MVIYFLYKLPFLLVTIINNLPFSVIYTGYSLP
nr:MAG TPA: hypothetical protein [Caudoviricetes sp.]